MATNTATTPDRSKMSDREIWNSFSGAYGNYGSLSLQLPPDWDRRTAGIISHAIVSAYVGHADGKSDVFRADNPKLPHDFAWCQIRNETDLDRKRELGFDFVSVNEGWVKNPRLWSTTQEGHIRRGSDEHLMYRSKEQWLESLEERKLAQARNIGAEADERLSAHAANVYAEDSEGKRLQPTERPRA